MKKPLATLALLALAIFATAGCIMQPKEHPNAEFVDLFNLINNPDKYYMSKDVPRRYQLNFLYYTLAHPVFITETKEIFGYSRVAIYELYNDTKFKLPYLTGLIGSNDLDPYLLYRLEGTLLEYELSDNSTRPFFIVSNWFSIPKSLISTSEPEGMTTYENPRRRIRS